MSHGKVFPHICRICGKEFNSTATLNYYCSRECRLKAKILLEKERKATEAAKKIRKQPPRTIAQVCKEAQAAGMTYGKYLEKEKNESESSGRFPQQ